MPIYPLHSATAPAANAGDADLLLRIGIALALRQRAGWHAVRVGVQHGVVRLAGIVPTIHDRQLIAAVTAHVAGVFRVADDLNVVSSAPAQRASDKPSTSIGAKPSVGQWQNQFLHLPLLAESLEDILANQGGADATS